MRVLLVLGMAITGVLPAALAAQMRLPQDLEIQVAKSALPAHLRDGATIYVWEPATGYVVAQEGSNGFHALASRVDPATFRAAWDYREHYDDVLLPIAFDAAGARSLLHPYLDAGRLTAEGRSARELKREMASRFASGHYRPADRPGVAFMLSPILRAFPDPIGSDRRVTLNLPHRMFYAPDVTNADIGGSPQAFTQPFVIQEGLWGYMVQRAGPDERDAINAEFRDMLARLCQHHAALCLERAADR